MIKKFIFLFTVLFSCAGVSFAQMENPVKWFYTAKKIADKTYELHITANLDGDWHIYAQDAGEGPEPTSINFTSNPLVKIEGKVKEAGELEKAYDPNFKSTLRYYSKEVDFIQKIKLKSNATTLMKGTITYMVCNDKKCLPPKEIPFSIKVAGK
ncbi:MAG: protein-disulfide reductase DsbD domain-containing protein [Ferruginibacter sp.]